MSKKSFFEKMLSMFQEYEFQVDEEIIMINAYYSKGRYYITNYGNVLSLCQNKWRLMAQVLDKDGYYYVSFQYGRRRVKEYTHRLVAKYFVFNPAPQQKNIVHHKDGNKGNNHFSNLQWCDAKEHSKLHSEMRGQNNECSELAEDTCKEKQ